jgi:hypothetical protein
MSLTGICKRPCVECPYKGDDIPVPPNDIPALLAAAENYRGKEVACHVTLGHERQLLCRGFIRSYLLEDKQ